MTQRAAALAGVLLCAPAAAQEVDIGTGAVLRGLEKVDGHVEDIALDTGETATFGRLRIELLECRYPDGNPQADAFAYLRITEPDAGAPRFAGWMIASAPALNALEHPRYDVWVLRCRTATGSGSSG